MLFVLLTVPQVPYNEPCVLGDVCADDNAVCRNGRCQCRDGFGLNDTGNTIVCGTFFTKRYFPFLDLLLFSAAFTYFILCKRNTRS